MPQSTTIGLGSVCATSLLEEDPCVKLTDMTHQNLDPAPSDCAYTPNQHRFVDHDTPSKPHAETFNETQTNTCRRDRPRCTCQRRNVLPQQDLDLALPRLSLVLTHGQHSTVLNHKDSNPKAQLLLSCPANCGSKSSELSNRPSWSSPTVAAKTRWIHLLRAILHSRAVVIGANTKLLIEESIHDATTHYASFTACEHAEKKTTPVLCVSESMHSEEQPAPPVISAREWARSCG